MSNQKSRWVVALITFLVTMMLATAVYANSIHTVQRGETLFSISRRYNTTVAALMQANNIVNPNLIFAGQQLVIPSGSTPPTATPVPPPPGATAVPPSIIFPTHIVRSGETLSSIARLYGVSVYDLATANNIANVNRIYVGQRLVIPIGGIQPPQPTPPPTGPTATPAPPQPTPPSGGMTTYVVQRGDTLSRIAVRFGVTVNAIMQANNITNPNLIFVGQVLNIPTGSGGGGGTNPPPPPPSGGLPQGFLLGGQTQTLAHPNLMNQAGMTWVKFQYKWSPGDNATAVAGLIEAGKNQGYKVLLSIPGANTYPPTNGIDFPAYTTFLREVASLPNPPDAIEIWNEMNIDFEWPAGQISPASYVQNMLAPGYNAIKSANPNIMVISGAPAPTGFDNNTNAWADDRYMRGMAAAGAANYLDCIGIHYNAGATSPSARTGHPGGSHYSWYFFPMIEVYSGAFNNSRPLCFTELGYLTGDGFGGLPPNFTWASNTTLSNHANWLAEAVSLSINDSRVRMLIIFNVDFTLFQPDGDPQAGYAMLRPGGACPSCDTIRNVTGGR